MDLKKLMGIAFIGGCMYTVQMAQVAEESSDDEPELYIPCKDQSLPLSGCPTRLELLCVSGDTNFDGQIDLQEVIRYLHSDHDICIYGVETGRQ